MNIDSLQTFKEFLVTESVRIPILTFIVNLLIAVVLSYCLGKVYTKYANTLSNKRKFSNNFIPLSMATVLIITIVKSSLALSLGLVGALSIVRFRAAIKEPEELIYLFVVIGIGLGLGADQRVITIIAVLMIIIYLITQYNFSTKTDNEKNLFITVSIPKTKNDELVNMVQILKENCISLDLKRFDESQTHLESCFFIEFSSFENLNNAKNQLRELYNDAEISSLSNSKVY